MDCFKLQSVSLNTRQKFYMSFNFYSKELDTSEPSVRSFNRIFLPIELLMRDFKYVTLHLTESLCCNIWIISWPRMFDVYPYYLTAKIVKSKIIKFQRFEEVCELFFAHKFYFSLIFSSSFLLKFLQIFFHFFLIQTIFSSGSELGFIIFLLFFFLSFFLFVFFSFCGEREDRVGYVKIRMKKNFFLIMET